jgi:hypothetical protein
MVLLAWVAIALPATWTSAHAQGQVQIEYFRATVHPLRNIVRLTWLMSEDTALTTIVVEHSLDNVMFTSIGEVAPIFTGGHGSNYEFWHVNPPVGLNYYRLRLVFSHGGEQLSNSAKVTVSGPGVFTFPRPKSPGIQSGQTDAWSEAIISDLYGRPVMSVKNEDDLDNADLPPGIYVLSLRYPSGWQSSTLVTNKNMY